MLLSNNEQRLRIIPFICSRPMKPSVCQSVYLSALFLHEVQLRQGMQLIEVLILIVWASSTLVPVDQFRGRVMHLWNSLKLALAGRGHVLFHWQFCAFRRVPSINCLKHDVVLLDQRSITLCKLKVHCACMHVCERTGDSFVVLGILWCLDPNK